jgi:hypothetical protein
MKTILPNILRFFIIITVLGIAASCFSSSFSKRKYTKGSFNDRIQMNSSNDEKVIREKLKSTSANDDNSANNIKKGDLEINEPLRLMKQPSSDKYEEADRHTLIVGHKKMLALEAFKIQNKSINEVTKKLSSEVRSNFKTKSSAPPYIDSEIVGAVLFLGGILFLLIYCIVALATGLEVGCLMVSIGFVMMGVGAIMLYVL